MGLFTELRRWIARLWGRTEQAVGEAYGNEALEYEGAADEAKVDAEEAAEGHRHGDRAHDRQPGGTDGPEAPEDDGMAGTPAR
ncbi:MAG: hypothetical protein M3313_09010 [Actinomycetota bacterium]|nr:hypothetical protein [Actinomycetota bacterium]